MSIESKRREWFDLLANGVRNGCFPDDVGDVTFVTIWLLVEFSLLSSISREGNVDSFSFIISIGSVVIDFLKLIKIYFIKS